MVPGCYSFTDTGSDGEIIEPELIDLFNQINRTTNKPD